MLVTAPYREGRNPMLPSCIVLTCHVMAQDFQAFARSVLALLGAEVLPPIARWYSATVSNGAPADLARAVEALPRAARHVDDAPIFIQFDTAGRVMGTVRFHPDVGGTAFGTANLQWVRGEADTADDLLVFQNHCLAITRQLLARFHVHSVYLRPEGSGGLCIPDVPLVDGNSHLVVANRRQVAEFYDDPDAFWSAGWIVVDDRDGQRLLARDMDVLGGAEYLARIIEPQWAMARAAKAGETVYSRPTVLPEEEPIFTAGEGRLHEVGYAEEEGLLEFSCALNPGEHIQGWEIFTLLSIIERGQRVDGSVVRTVRVVFLDRWMAEREKRPLLDIGCRVLYYGDDGELHELAD